jgi:hypothetical protein
MSCTCLKLFFCPALLIPLVRVEATEFICANLKQNSVSSTPDFLPGGIMSVRNGIVLLVALSTLLFLAACANNGTSIATPVAPPSGSFSNSNLNGTYVFSISGSDVNGAPYAMVGTFTANGSGGTGKGGITGGTLDINDGTSSQFSAPVAGVSINNNSTYSVGPDGRGEAVIGTNITSGTPGVTFPNLTFDFVLTDSSHGLITEFDSFGTGSGTLDLQAANPTPTGAYAFSLSGASGTSSWAAAGNFNVSGGTISSGLEDINEAALVNFNAESVTGTLALGPSTNPTTTLITSTFPSGMLFDAVAIDATHLKFIEMDTTATLSGDVYSQTSAALPTGTMAFTLAGLLGAGSAGVPFASGGFMTNSASGAVTGTEDYNDGGSLSSATAPGSFGATFAAAGTGRYTLGSFTTFVPGNPTYVAYPSSGGLLLLESDDAGIAVGAAYPQTAGATLAVSQGYGMNLSGIFLGSSATEQPPAEVDDIAEFTTASGGTITGIIDENSDSSNGPTLGIALSSGTYGAIDSNGRYGVSAAAVNNNTGAGTLLGGFNLTAYAVDGTTFPFIESDSGQVSAGVIVLQNPSASGAAIAHSRMFVVRPLIRPHAASKKKPK